MASSRQLRRRASRVGRRHAPPWALPPPPPPARLSGSSSMQCVATCLAWCAIVCSTSCSKLSGPWRRRRSRRRSFGSPTSARAPRCAPSWARSPLSPWAAGCVGFRQVRQVGEGCCSALERARSRSRLARCWRRAWYGACGRAVRVRQVRLMLWVACTWPGPAHRRDHVLAAEGQLLVALLGCES